MYENVSKYVDREGKWIDTYDYEELIRNYKYRTVRLTHINKTKTSVTLWLGHFDEK